MAFSACTLTELVWIPGICCGHRKEFKAKVDYRVLIYFTAGAFLLNGSIKRK
jgi:hypothetical protein